MMKSLIGAAVMVCAWGSMSGTRADEPVAPSNGGPESVAAKTFDMTVTRVFDAPVEKVWRAWSEEKHVKQWWGPTGFSCPECKMDFRVGGKTLVCMRAPKEFGGQEMYRTWTYTKIEPQQRIELVHHFADKDGNAVDPAEQGLPPGMPKKMPHVVTFKALEGNKTELTIVESGYTTKEIVELSKEGMNQCQDKMAEDVKGE